jgi:hypothetical protein
MAVRQDCDKTRLKLTDEFCDRLPISNILYNIVTTSFFKAIDREAKELLPRGIFIITRRYKMVEIQQ